MSFLGRQVTMEQYLNQQVQFNNPTCQPVFTQPSATSTPKIQPTFNKIETNLPITQVALSEPSPTATAINQPMYSDINQQMHTNSLSMAVNQTVERGDISTKRRAMSTLSMSLTTGDDGIETSLKDYLDQMKLDITSKITNSEESLRSLITSQDSEIKALQDENLVLQQRGYINEGRLTRVEKLVADLKEEQIRSQQHSMKENLIFQNLPEVASENVYNTLREYMMTKMKISADDMKNVGVVRAHRMGKQGSFPRAIVAKINDAGRITIFRHTKNLRGTNTSVFTQLPRELAERRKQLVPHYKDARSKNVTAKWYGDKLQVGDKMMAVTPDKVPDINVDTVDRACKLKVVRAPPTTREGSSFQGSRVKIDDPVDVIPALQAIYADYRAARATHNVYAYRIQMGSTVVEHFDDDGEFGAGHRLLELLQKQNIVNTMVCVTRWYGGKHLGPVRYQIITENAEQVLRC